MSTAASAPYYLHAIIQVKPGRSDDFLRMMVELKAAMRHEFGVELVHSLRGHEKPGSFMNLWSIPDDAALARVMQEAPTMKLMQDIEACMEHEVFELLRPSP